MLTQGSLIPSTLATVFRLSGTALFKDFNRTNKQCLEHIDSGVYFLISQRGEAIECHVAADGRKGRKNIRKACLAFVDMIPVIFPWCKMLIAPVDSKSVYNLCINIGFEDYGLAGNEAGEFNMMVINYG